MIPVVLRSRHPFHAGALFSVSPRPPASHRRSRMSSLHCSPSTRVIRVKEGRCRQAILPCYYTVNAAAHKVAAQHHTAQHAPDVADQHASEVPAPPPGLHASATPLRPPPTCALHASASLAAASNAQYRHTNPAPEMKLRHRPPPPAGRHSLPPIGSASSVIKRFTTLRPSHGVVAPPPSACCTMPTAPSSTPHSPADRPLQHTGSPWAWPAAKAAEQGRPYAVDGQTMHLEGMGRWHMDPPKSIRSRVSKSAPIPSLPLRRRPWRATGEGLRRHLDTGTPPWSLRINVPAIAAPAALAAISGAHQPRPPSAAGPAATAARAGGSGGEGSRRRSGFSGGAESPPVSPWGATRGEGEEPYP